MIFDVLEKKKKLDLEFNYLIKDNNTVYQNETRLLELDRILKCKLKKTPYTGEVDFSLFSINKMDDVVSCNYEIKLLGDDILLTVNHGEKEVIFVRCAIDFSRVDISSKSFKYTDIANIYVDNKKTISSLIKIGCEIYDLIHMFKGPGNKISMPEFGLEYFILSNGETKICVCDYLKQIRAEDWLSKGLSISDVERYLNLPWNKKAILNNMIVSNSRLNDNYKGYVLKESKNDFQMKKTLI